MLRFISLASGSSGNCYFFTNDKVSFLVDAGVGVRTCDKRLAEHGLSLKQVDFILVTHDHIDHIKALGVIASKYSKPVYATSKLLRALLKNACTRNRLNSSLHGIEVGVSATICGVEVSPFAVCHDATQTVGYKLVLSGRTIVILTDCGQITAEVLENVSKADILLLESNYDSEMLQNGLYPKILQDRISGGNGHLSNNQAAEILMKTYPNRIGRMKHIYLCHISANNNTPKLALDSARGALIACGANVDNIILTALPRGRASALYSL